MKGCEYELSYKSNQVCKECKGTRAYMGDKSYIYNCSICKGYGYEIIRTKTLFGIHEEQTVCRYCGGTGEKITKECTACKRQGYVSEAKKVTIKIPGGVQNGAVLLFRDTQSFDEQKIQLCIHVSSSEIFTREGDNLKTTIYVNPLTLILGGTIEVPTPYGLKKVTLAPGSTTKEFKLKGMGITHNKKGMGDLFVKPEIGSLKLSSLELEKIKSIKLSELKETKDWLKQFKKEYGA
nr:DnaJ C-terminal domain-containing protein [Candidatus Mycoplasma haematolamae]